MPKDLKDFESATEKYTRGKVIGEGGSGRVFEATNSAGERLAIKVLHPAQATGNRRRRFANELNFLRKNTHPNIVTVLDEGLVEWGGVRTPFYVMPLYAGTLRTDMRGGIDAVSALRGFAQLLDGVEAAHLQGIIHRDLKPENILIAHGPRYIVADFGVAHFEEDEIFTAVETKDSERLANFLYAAPEQRIKGATVGRTADIFSLGLILNEMFTEEVIQGTGFKRIGAVAAEYVYLDEIVDKLVQNSPNSRYQSIDDLKKELVGRRNQFVSRQQLNAATKAVLPAFAPGQVQPVMRFPDHPDR